MPRLRLASLQATFGLGACVALLAWAVTATGALAQTSSELSPETGWSPEADPPRFLKRPEGTWTSDDPPRFQKRPDYGNPPGSGAGRTGFVSTNPRRPPRGAAQTPYDIPASPLVPVQTVRVAPVPAQPPLPPSYNMPPLPPPSDPLVTGSIPPPKPKPKQPDIDPYEALGIRAGSLIWLPAIELTGGYDTNPHRTEDGEGSSLFIVAPELQVKSDWERHEFRANLRGSYSAYGAASSLDNPNFSATLDERLDWTRQTRVELQQRFLVATDTPGSPNFQAAVAKPTIYTSIGGDVGIKHRFNRVEVGGKLSVDRTQYEASELTNGATASNDDRNFSEFGLELRGSYEFTPGVKPFVAFETDSRKHDLAVDSFGMRRDSKGLAPRIGTTFELSRLLTGEASLGYLTRTYDDPRLKDLSGATVDASLVWLATALTKATFTAKSTVYENTDPDVSGVFARDLGVRLDHSFRPWLVATLKLGFGLDDYVGSSREDNRFSAGAELTYKLNRMVQIKGELRHEQRSSNVADQDYAANIFLLGLRLQR